MNNLITRSKAALGVVLFGMIALTALGFGLLTMGLAIVVGTLFGVAAQLGSGEQADAGDDSGEIHEGEFTPADAEPMVNA